ncbi:cornifelin homolog [Pyxicephalus adspersus]|uniref:cornifelin homolog n=1 Tax=Pyxicephalus adspersus TaxID=30357 RepID=UPI003B5A976F
MAVPVITQQPGYGTYPAMSPTGEWSSQLCDCCGDCGICLFGFFFPTCLACYVADKYGENCCLPLVPGGMTAMRTHMRLTYGIQGTVCNDGLMMFCCGWCELCRMAREVKRHRY